MLMEIWETSYQQLAKASAPETSLQLVFTSVPRLQMQVRFEQKRTKETKGEKEAAATGTILTCSPDLLLNSRQRLEQSGKRKLRLLARFSPFPLRFLRSLLFNVFPFVFERRCTCIRILKKRIG